MAIHHSSSPLVLAGHAHPRDGLTKDLLSARNVIGDSGTMKRFERFISPYLATHTPPTDDFLDGLIQRNSWLR
jgi:hypothetical protein